MKPKFKTNIDCYENGQGILITRTKDNQKWGRVFLIGQEKESREWINKIIEENKGEQK